jgi:hypothetical protein
VTASRRGCLTFAFLLLGVASARGQSAVPRFEATGSLFLTGATDFGTRPATLTGNEPGNPDFTLFSTTTRLGTGIGPEARLAVALSKAFSVEGAFSWVRQTLETRITGDAENAPNTTATQPISTTSVGADALVRLTSIGFANGRGVPFVLGGAGYFRQTDDHQVLDASGAYFEVGGGVRYVVSERAAGFPRALALRGDGRVIVRSEGFDVGASGGSRATWGLTAGLSVAF